MTSKNLIFQTLLLTLLGVASLSYANENHPLTGTWSSQCATNDAGGFMIETFKFTDNDATYSTKTFTDPACKTQVSDLATYRNFTLGAPVKSLADTRKLDYVFKSVTMSYTDAAAVAAANKEPGYYGLTDWQLNQAKTVTGLKKTKDSSAERSAGEKFFTIVKMDKNKLYMGDYSSGAGTSDATRLSAIYHIPFIRAD